MKKNIIYILLLSTIYFSSCTNTDSKVEDCYQSVYLNEMEVNVPSTIMETMNLTQSQNITTEQMDSIIDLTVLYFQSEIQKN